MSRYLSAEAFAELQALEAIAPPPPLYLETAYSVTRDGIERGYRFDTTAAGLRLHHAMRRHLPALLRELEDWWREHFARKGKSE